MISRIGSKKTAYSVERIAFSKSKNIFLSLLSAIRYPLSAKKSAIRYPLNARMGFTLIEVMVACAVLSIGIVFIYESFFRLLNAFDYYQNYVRIAPIANEKMWQAQDILERFGPRAQIEAQGQLFARNKNFSWNLSYGLLEEIKASSLYKIELSISWKEGQRTAKLVRSTYALYTQKK